MILLKTEFFYTTLGSDDRAVAAAAAAAARAAAFSRCRFLLCSLLSFLLDQLELLQAAWLVKVSCRHFKVVGLQSALQLRRKLGSTMKLFFVCLLYTSDAADE